MMPILYLVFLTYLRIVCCGYTQGFTEQDEDIHLKSYFDYDSGFLVVATLDGSLIAVDKKTGDTRWTLKNEPAVKVFMKHKTTTSPVFLPDPKDGSLYLFNVEESHGLTKLPFSIQQLVADSPTRSQDGIFYFGKKHDTWISIDNITGEKNVLFSTEEFEKVCPIQSPNVFFIGRTEYNLALIDSKRNSNNWNITYYDYASRILTSDQLNKYGYVHISASSSGRVRTLDRKTGLVQWERDFGSPMVALYLEWGKDLFNLPFTSAADLSLEALSSTLNSDELQSTLFIGEHSFGYYALPAVVDSKVSILSDTLSTSRFLLSGPNDKLSIAPLVLGHYTIPTTPKIPLRIAGKHKTNQIIFTDILNTSVKSILTEGQKTEVYISPESKILSIIIGVFAISVIAMFVYIIRQVREIKQSSQGSNVGLSRNVCSYDSQKGIVTIGKITFNSNIILGRGCAGTVVYRGNFDGRDVAVKRLLPENFTIADREVELLRETDSHPNVIRYFSTEQDNQFRYIVLELCSATLEDYVERGSYKEDITFVDVLKQATLGLEHLHSLKIVHRDIKPNNILLSKGIHNKIQVMISDFGLCKKMANDRNSFSKSGLTGTVGWIAPEMMESSGRIMPAVDIFSLGCVFYYTIVGKHPFGELLTRQSNILSGISKLHLNDKLWKSLISQMIHSDPLKRPTAFVVKSHPVFWKKSFTLSFLLDVSDRVDKENYHSSILFHLEEGGESVYIDDWIKMIDAEVSEDLGKYRTYRGDSVRDLLRAFRNKRHHYLELSQTTQQILGATAESYVNYWFSRFPVLLYHVWSSLQLLHDEPLFNQYYNMSYMFPCDKSGLVPKWLDDMKTLEASRNNKKLKTSPVKSKNKTKYKMFNPINNTAYGNDTAKDSWIKEGEKTGVWRPKQ